MYRWVSSPNYLGEITEWTGFAVMTWNLPGLAFMVFTIANLFPRAFSHHRWYLEKFPDYPKDRKAILPFIA
jgi:protein-S-isoprenylcysteine O-methyltransferase Ste14